MSIGSGIAAAGLFIAIGLVAAISVKIDIKWPSDLTINHNYKKENNNG